VNPRPRRLIVTLATLVGLGAFGLAFASLRSGGGSEQASLTGPVGVLSPRRAPEVLRDLVAQTRLASRIGAFAQTLAPTSCLSVAAGDAPVFARNPDLPLTPASSLKLTTGAAFLAALGGKDTFSTVVRSARPVQGVVTGDLALVGGGDPLLATDGYVTSRHHPPKPATDLGALARSVKQAGVNHVTGRITVSDNRFDAERRVASWSPGYTSNGDVGPIGALALNDGFASYAPLVAAGDPAIAAGQAFRDALVAAGVAVDGGVVRAAPSGVELARVDSAPYAEVVGEMLRESDNNTAELLLKELAYEAGTKPATRAAGIAARSEALRKLGVAADAVVAIDGSGLDRSDKATCRALLATLLTKPGGYDLEAMLAVAGQSGTLDDRFLTSPLKGVLRAKTGSLNDVTALVGVTDASQPKPIRFAFIANAAFTDAGGKALQDRLVSALATYPEAPPAASLAP
jgi:D-alanyl-D-alanine carboxypeptidase/D-alanyl-D-alanine-endopeptidase (penicillin-binding protein 4)